MTLRVSTSYHTSKASMEKCVKRTAPDVEGMTRLAISRTRRLKGALRISSSVDFWNLRISCSDLTPVGHVLTLTYIVRNAGHLFVHLFLYT
jgi:hypothetical protein